MRRKRYAREAAASVSYLGSVPRAQQMGRREVTAPEHLFDEDAKGLGIPRDLFERRPHFQARFHVKLRLRHELPNRPVEVPFVERVLPTAYELVELVITDDTVAVIVEVLEDGVEHALFTAKAEPLAHRSEEFHRVDFIAHVLFKDFHKIDHE